MEIFLNVDPKKSNSECDGNSLPKNFLKFFLVCLNMCLLFLCLFLSLFVLCLLDFPFRSIFAFWTLLLMVTCLFIIFFGEFESEKFSCGMCYTENDSNAIAREKGIPKDIKNGEIYRKMRQWSDFESRKGFRVMSYVGFFGEVFSFFFFEIFLDSKFQISFLFLEISR